MFLKIYLLGVFVAMICMFFYYRKWGSFTVGNLIASLIAISGSWITVVFSFLICMHDSDFFDITIWKRR